CRRRRLAFGRGVALASTDGQARTLQTDLHAPEAAVAPSVVRIVPEQVVAAVVLDDMGEGLAEIVPVDDCESACVFGDRPQAVLRSPELVAQRRVAQTERRVVGNRGDVDPFVAQAAEAPRIDAVE